MTPILRTGLSALAVAFAGLIAPHGAVALDLAFPGNAVAVLSEEEPGGRHEIATGPWRDGALPTRGLTGSVARSVWQLQADDETVTVQTLADALEAQLSRQGYEIVLSCRDRMCGGFDFRRSLDLGQAPEMHVDIGNFRYVSGLGEAGETGAAITVSRGGGTLYVHAVRVGAAIPAPADPPPSSRGPQDTDAAPPTLGERLLSEGAVALDDLAFRTGASELSAADYASLRALASFLSANPQRRVVLVGHTDSRGGAESNAALSEARAQAVRDHLVERLGTDPGQVDTAGIGFLAPRASNATPEGREANRRVEVVLLDGD